MILNLHQFHLDRLHQQGVITNEAPALLRDLFKIRESGIGIDAAMATSKLHLLGWNDLIMHNYSLRLVLARMVSWLD